ncbi:hypothetical protein [Kordiimonas pumila]|uniref:Uncharacterized protein n=1 Tax=Kordiimonas pumila TaxID=2161677 RepID=A0ABV7D6B7_9PROT|nr:hypothetical protein [Kordiimonas pumila]
MQKPASTYGMTKVEYQRRLQAFEQAQAYREAAQQPRDGLFTRLFKRSH